MLANDKLYIIVRNDLNTGSKLAQSCHVAFEFYKSHPEVAKSWMEASNYICILSVESENEISEILMKAIDKNITHSVFREPDFDDSITAIALEPGPISKKLCSKLKLAS